MNDRMREALETAVDAMADANEVLAQCKIATEPSIYDKLCLAYEKCRDALSALKPAPSDDEVERVARAIQDYRGCDGKGCYEAVNYEEAKAAIAAMDARAEVGEVDVEAGAEALNNEIWNGKYPWDLRSDAIKGDMRDYARICAKTWNLKIKEQKPCSEK